MSEEAFQRQIEEHGDGSETKFGLHSGIGIGSSEGSEVRRAYLAGVKVFKKKLPYQFVIGENNGGYMPNKNQTSSFTIR